MIIKCVIFVIFGTIGGSRNQWLTKRTVYYPIYYEIFILGFYFIILRVVPSHVVGLVRLVDEFTNFYISKANTLLTRGHRYILGSS